MSKDNQRNLASILGVLFLIALAALAWVYVDRMSLKQQLEGRITEMAEVQANLEIEYEEAITSLDALQGENEELNNLIEGQKKELANQKSRISSLIRQNKDLKSVRAEIDNLKSQAAQYLAEIEQLRAENLNLAASNSMLNMEKDSLAQNLLKEVAQKEEVLSANTSLNEFNQRLSQANEALDNKVTKASVLNVNDLEASSLMLAGNGKEKKKKNADKVDQISVCFSVEPNVIADKGMETFFLRIIQPTGETMSIESKGSGMFMNRDLGQEMRYTISGSFDYTQESKNVCMEWQPEIPFQQGDYAIELYNKGYLSGKTSLTLK